jgi:hypothetical protein
MDSNLPIIETNYGLASVYPGECIEVNAKLSGELKDKILKHEKSHSRNRQYSREDFKNDFQSQNSYFIESLKFCLKNPESFIGFFPLMYSYYFKAFTWNTAGLMPFAYFGAIFSLFFWLIFHVNFFYALIGYTAFFFLINLSLLIITHLLKNLTVKQEQVPQPSA